MSLDFIFIGSKLGRFPTAGNRIFRLLFSKSAALKIQIFHRRGRTGMKNPAPVPPRGAPGRAHPVVAKQIE
ncbi:MAG: hypothetical protein ACLFRP_09730, partial [Puniceicoccaceae bacterium]